VPTLPDYTIADLELMARAHNYIAWQRRLVTPELGRRVIEVGCGIGNFTEMLLDREWAGAIDVEPACVARLRERFPGIYAEACAPGSVAFAQLVRFGPDSCVCVNVLEHIEDDRAALAAMASVLAPGGVIVVLVPAFAVLYGPIDRNLQHARRYSRADLRTLAQTCGLEIRKLHYVNAVGFFGWWMNAHIFRREVQSRTQIEIFDRYIVPWLSRLEAIEPPPFGQSLFAVLRKL